MSLRKTLKQHKRSIPIISVSIYQLLEACTKQSPDAIAITAPDRSPLNYGRLLEQIQMVVVKLNELGIGRNDRVAIVLPNGPEVATAFLSVSTGATSAPLNPNYPAPEFEFFLSDLKARALIILAGMVSPAREVADRHGIPVIELTPTKDGPAGLFTLSGTSQPLTSAPGLAQAEDVALVLHTSGTTSRPKMVPLSHQNLCTSAQNICTVLQLTPDDICLNVMPLFHIHGLMAAVLSSLTAGASVLCTPGFNKSRFFNWIECYRPTWYTAVPTMHQAVLAVASLHKETIKQNPLRFIRSSSASLPPQVMADLETVFEAPVIESYGMTEASHQMASNPLPPNMRKPGSVGLSAGPEVAIMDEAGHLVSSGETSEIVIRGMNVTKGYEHNPDANEIAFTHGWFRTGDQGYLDEDGYLFITGRLKELINRGGEKIAPREIDEVLMTHPEIDQAVAFSVPHPTLGEDMAMAVILSENATMTEQEIREFAFSKLVDYKVPSRIVIVDQIPKGPTGKLQRIGLATKLETQLKTKFVEPCSQTEEILAEIWTDILGIEQVSIHDNFFSLGGDSLTATQVTARIQSAFQIDLPLPLLFREPTITGLAIIVEKKQVRIGDQELISQMLNDLEGISEEKAQEILIDKQQDE